MEYSEHTSNCKPENASDPFSILANQKTSPPSGFDFAAYEKRRKEDEELLVECIIDQKDGTKGCRLYETKRRPI